MPNYKRLMISLRVLLCLVLLSSCAVPTKLVTQKPFFDTLQVIKLDVAEFEVVSNYKAPLTPPNIEHLFQTMPVHVIQNFGEKLFVATGKERKAKLIIVDASVIAESLEIRPDLRGLLTIEQKERYTARAELRLEIRSNRGFLESHASVRVHVVRSIPEGLTLNEIDIVFREITRALVSKLNIELEKQVNRYLGGFLAV